MNPEPKKLSEKLGRKISEHLNAEVKFVDPTNARIYSSISFLGNVQRQMRQRMKRIGDSNLLPSAFRPAPATHSDLFVETPRFARSERRSGKISTERHENTLQ